MRKGRRLLLLIVGLFILLAVLASGWSVNLPSPLPPAFGPGKPVTVVTEVYVYKPWGYLLEPYAKIVKVRNEVVGNARAEVEYQPRVLFGDFHGKVVLEVVCPDGSVIRGSKDVYVPWGGTTKVTFVWTTMQRGTHKVIAYLYDDSGKLVCTYTSEVTV